MKYHNSSIYKVLGKYPACEKIDLQLEEVVSKIENSKRLLE